MVNGLKLYLRYISYSIASQMQYRASFVLMTLGNFSITIIEYLSIWALFGHFGALRGWALPEIAVFYSVINMAFAVSEAWSRGFDTFGRQVRSGEFDRFLLRPRSIALQMLGQEFQLMRIGRFIQGAIILLWAVGKLEIGWTVAKAALLLASIAGGSFVFSGLFVLQATMCFWTVETVELANTVTAGGVQTAQYPLGIYRKELRGFFTYIVPLACANYFPVLEILGRDSQVGLSAYLPWISPFVGPFFFYAALQVFLRIGVRHYCSTGS